MEEKTISITQHEREIRRWFIAFLIVLIAFIGTATGWIISEKTRDEMDEGFFWLVPDEDIPDEQAYG